MAADPIISVVIPTRNRPELVRRAILSVLKQTYSSYEVIVVNDGSNQECVNAYDELSREFSHRLTVLDLVPTNSGHGQSYAINRGVDIARGDYITFLDDDDYWIDPEHLERAARLLSSAPISADIYYTNQVAYRGETQVEGPLWLQGLETILRSHGISDIFGAYNVSLKDLMACPGFQHLNTTIIRASLHREIGGLDENIRYECDWDYYLRSIDAARIILYFPGITSRHNAPDPAETANMSTVISGLQKLLFRSYVLDKAVLFSQSHEIREMASRNKAFTLKHIAETLSADGRFREAACYAREALAEGLTLKWLAYVFYVSARSVFRKN